MKLRLTEFFEDIQSNDEEVKESNKITPSNDPNILFEHFPKFFDTKYFRPLMKALKPKVGRQHTSYSTSKRKSCIYSLKSNDKDGNYYPYSQVPTVIKKIKKKLEDFTGETYDYVLCHIYYDGKGSLGYHNDEEAMNTSVCSVSFGATRKFRFRKIDKKSGWDKEFHLGSGDLFIMYKGCQSKYKHSVPVESKVKSPRINLTFRMYE